MGERGVLHLAERCEAIVVVDVLRFTTAVDVAVARGYKVRPAPGVPVDDRELSPAAVQKAQQGGKLPGLRDGEFVNVLVD